MMETLNKLVQLMPIIKAGLQKNLRSLVELNLLETTTYLRDKIRSIKCVGILMHLPLTNMQLISDGPKNKRQEWLACTTWLMITPFITTSLNTKINQEQPLIIQRLMTT